MEKTLRQPTQELEQKPPTHVALPIEIFNDIAGRISKMPWDVADPILGLIKQHSSGVTITPTNQQPLKPVENDTEDHATLNGK